MRNRTPPLGESIQYIGYQRDWRHKTTLFTHHWKEKTGVRISSPRSKKSQAKGFGNPYMELWQSGISGGGETALGTSFEGGRGGLLPTQITCASRQVKKKIQRKGGQFQL